MESGDRAAGDRQEPAATPRSRLFAVRLWIEDAADRSKYRGCVRDVGGGAYRNFREWSDLAAFMMARMDEDASVRSGRTEGATE
jgi:hypothetical protein